MLGWGDNMTELNQVWKCNICGNIIAVVHKGADSLVCCGQPMELQQEKINEEGTEKHLPVVEFGDCSCGCSGCKSAKVKIGSVEHPMEEKHFIEFIEVIVDGKVNKVFLKPGQKPEAEFCCVKENIQARAYCNVHGLWSKK